MKHAFTLSEVLITLGIIGVVSAITLPILIKNYQKKVTVNKLKQTYNILYQAIKMSEIDNDSFEHWNIPTAAWNNNQQYTKAKPFAEKYLLPYLEVAVKDCGLGTNICLPSKCYSLNNEDMSAINGYGVNKNNKYYTFALKNGVVISVLLASKNLSKFTLLIFLDGKRKTAIIGKNVFWLHSTGSGLKDQTGNTNKAGIFFQGHGYDRNILLKNNIEGGYGCNKKQNGVFCGELIMLDGWKIAPDYPW